MIAIVVVRPNIIFGREYLFSPHIELFLFIFWQNTTYYSKESPFFNVFKSGSKEVFVKGDTGRAISDETAVYRRFAPIDGC
jgi:hypothetical protein